MKKIIILSTFLVVSLAVSAQSSWRWGLSLSAIANHSSYSGGMHQANARFHHNEMGTGIWSVNFRKDINTHLCWQTGLQFSGIGFNYAIAEDYSLLNKEAQYTTNQLSAPTIAIPVSLIYRFNPNCRNYRWYVGGGVSLVGVGAPKKSSQNVSPTDEANLNPASDYLNQTVAVNSNVAVNGHVVAGVDKLFKSGRILSLGIIVNGGFTQLMKSTVNYQLNNQSYTHTFSNFGNFAGLQLSYYFKPFKGKALSAVK